MARPRKYKGSHVISFRISDDELAVMNRTMTSLKLTRMSDLMREVMGVVGSANAKILPRPGVSSPPESARDA